MNIYCAPMEGLTLFPFRQVHHDFFPGISKYYTPFLVANQTLHFKKKEIRELLPDNNKGICVVPQVLTNKPDEFLWAVRTIQGYGYTEINLNLGCPSPTVVTRGRGAGMLADTENLDRFFEAVFNEMTAAPETYQARISVKTRTGMEEHCPKELMEIYNRYPICELIIHPRRRVDQYQGTPDWDVFEEMLEKSEHPVCYNGEINTVEDHQRLKERFPDLQAVMIGRGLIRDPALAQKIEKYNGQGYMEHPQENAGKSEDSADYSDKSTDFTDTRLLWSYQKELCHRYAEAIDGERDVVAKMKEVWSFMADLFPENKKGLKQIRKAKTYEQYEEGVRRIMEQS